MSIWLHVGLMSTRLKTSCDALTRVQSPARIYRHINIIKMTFIVCELTVKYLIVYT